MACLLYSPVWVCTSAVWVADGSPYPSAFLIDSVDFQRDAFRISLLLHHLFRRLYPPPAFRSIPANCRYPPHGDIMWRIPNWELCGLLFLSAKCVLPQFNHSLYSVCVSFITVCLIVGTFTLRGLAASSLNHCGYTDPYPSHRRLLTTLLLSWMAILGYYS